MDKRDHRRFQIHRRAELKLATGQVVVGVTRDLSFGGSFIECDSEGIRSGEECTVVISLGDDAGLTEIYGDIRYSNHYGVGCHFITFNSGYYHFLTGYTLHNFEE